MSNNPFFVTMAGNERMPHLRLPVDSNGYLIVSSLPLSSVVQTIPALQQANNLDARTVIGRCDSVNAKTTPTDIIPAGAGALQHWPSAEIPAASINIVSDHANDSHLLNAGAKGVYIRGISGTGQEQEEIVPLEGLTVVHPTLNYLWINDAFCSEAGASGQNDGNITIGYAGGTLRYIVAGRGIAQHMNFMVPKIAIGGQPFVGAYVLQMLSHLTRKQISAVEMIIKYRDENTNIWIDYLPGGLSENSDFDFKVLIAQQVNLGTQLRLTADYATVDNLLISAAGIMLLTK